MRIAALGLCVSLATASLHAETYLPPAELVMPAIRQRAEVIAATDRAQAAEAQARALALGEHEAEISISPQRRRTDHEGNFDEWEVQLGRRFRLPGKAELDRGIGRHVVASATINREASEHHAAVRLLDLWMEWLFAVAAETQAGQQLLSVQQARDALARRADMGDAARLEVDLMDAELAQAAVEQTEHAAARQTMQLTLEREFPGLPLPVRSPVLPEPEKLTGEVAAWVARIVEHDHALRAMREEVSRQDLTAQRARADRIPDPLLGVRVLDERDGAERSVGLVFSMPIGSGNRAARADAAMADARASRRDSEAMRRESELEARLTVTHATHAVNRWQAQYRAYNAMALAAARTRKAWELGETDLADRLLADRREREAAIDEQRMRADALKAALLVRLDSHELWAEPH